MYYTKVFIDLICNTCSHTSTVYIIMFKKYNILLAPIKTATDHKKIGHD